MRCRSATARSRPTRPTSPGEGITLSRYDDYAGEQKANAQTLEYRTYTDIGTGFLDVQGGNLDVQKDLPPDAVSSAKDEFGDRYVERPSSSFTYLAFPLYDPRFGDKRVRQAFSMAIDREAITEAVFSGTRVPAASVISPVVDGARDDACTYCVLRPHCRQGAARPDGFRRLNADRPVVQRRCRS